MRLVGQVSFQTFPLIFFGLFFIIHFKFFYYTYLFVETREQYVEVGLLFLTWAPRNQTQAIRLGSKHIYPLSHLTDPIITRV